MTLATRSLGADRSSWAQAMTAEFDVAEEDGRPLRFALGCLWCAWRMMPKHAEGRFVLASYALSIGLLMPIAAVLALAAAFGFPFVAPNDGLGGYLSGSGTHVLLLNAGNAAAAMSLTLVMLSMAAYHLPLAWWTLDRDWERVASAHRFGAATATTLLMVTSCAALDTTQLLLPIAALMVEWGALSALTWWHARLVSDGRAEEFVATG